jgi:hypothetical protein
MKEFKEIVGQGKGLALRKQVGDAEGQGDFAAYFDWYDPAGGKRHLWMKLSRAYGWEHLMVDGGSKTPSWDEMCVAKSLFWGSGECCVEFHPAESEYVNNSEHCLHIWKPVSGGFPTPPTAMVGIKGASAQETKAMASAMASMVGRKAVEEHFGFVENRSLRRMEKKGKK